jgi:hypothetical protein
MNDHYKVDGWTDLERAAQGILAKESFDAAVAKRVAELFERIKQLQRPELDAIRERNRLRDAREQRQQGGERVVAQVIALAA